MWLYRGCSLVHFKYLSSSLQLFLHATLWFTITRGTNSYVLLLGHPSSNDGLVKCMLPFFIAERGSRLAGRTDQWPYTGNGLNCTGWSTSVICQRHGLNVYFLRYMDLRWCPAVDDICHSARVCHLPRGRWGDPSTTRKAFSCVCWRERVCMEKFSILFLVDFNH